MRLTARQIIGSWISNKVNLTNIERILELPFGSLASLHTEEGPAAPEMEVLLNMVNKCPWLLAVADANFAPIKIVRDLFKEWEETQKMEENTNEKAK